MNFDNLQLNDPRITDDCKQEFRLRVGRYWPTAGEFEPFAAIWAMAFLFGQGQQSDVQPEAVQVPLCVRTAPERIWLQVSDDKDHLDEAFPRRFGAEVTWCEDSAMDCEVEYIRADLASPHPPAPAKPNSQALDVLRECELFIRVLGLDSEPAAKLAEQAREVLAQAQGEARGDEPRKATPYEPTSEMLTAARGIDPAIPLEHVRRLWWLMWKAAPQAGEADLADLCERIGRHLGASWIVIGPDGSRFLAETPLRAANEANKHRGRLMFDPAKAQELQAAIDQIRADSAAENDRLLAMYGSLNCPTCGGSGHVGDVEALQLTSRERCHADRDGDCRHADCPQLRDGEPRATGRHCPLDVSDSAHGIGSGSGGGVA